MSILLVEGEPAIRSIIAFYLEEAGLHVCEAANAQEALDLLLDPCLSFSVLVTNLGLGRGDCGLELAATARMHSRELLVVYQTGSPEKLHGRALADWETLFRKPCDLDALADAVFSLDRQAARRRRHRAAAASGDQGIVDALTC